MFAQVAAKNRKSCNFMVLLSRQWYGILPRCVPHAEFSSLDKSNSYSGEFLSSLYRRSSMLKLPIREFNQQRRLLPVLQSLLTLTYLADMIGTFGQSFISFPGWGGRGPVEWAWNVTLLLQGDVSYSFTAVYLATYLANTSGALGQSFISFPGWRGRRLLKRYYNINPTLWGITTSRSTVFAASFQANTERALGQYFISFPGWRP